eukprot:SAG22_NODE_7702_length_716_cov_0.841167_1_plen_176_part_00
MAAQPTFLDGERVRVHGLESAAHLNGRCGSVLAYNKVKMRFQVAIDGDPAAGAKPLKKIMVRALNLVREDGGTAVLAAAAAAGEARYGTPEWEAATPSEWRQLGQQTPSFLHTMEMGRLGQRLELLTSRMNPDDPAGEAWDANQAEIQLIEGRPKRRRTRRARREPWAALWRDRF